MSATLKMKITPAKGLTVPKDDGTALAASGELLAVTPYWHRRARDGDVTIAAARARPAPRKRKAASKPKAAKAATSKAET